MKYIYEEYNPNLRCRVKWVAYLSHYELQVQRRWFWFIWINCFPWMTVSDGFWGECERFPVLHNDYIYGNRSESYMTGTLDIKKRVAKLFKEYRQDIAEKDAGAQKLQEL